ncbi:hypothetical protein BHE74_00045236 [Ensete ventricosum]|nr:hypothetical protein BHE74_00045236 [Ensete ventricosum]RZR98066.1 hypothetical protein BHM03_00027366 [Ensete ventricosum]
MASYEPSTPFGLTNTNGREEMLGWDERFYGGLSPSHQRAHVADLPHHKFSQSGPPSIGAAPILRWISIGRFISVLATFQGEIECNKIEGRISRVEWKKEHSVQMRHELIFMLQKHAVYCVQTKVGDFELYRPVRVVCTSPPVDRYADRPLTGSTTDWGCSPHYHLKSIGNGRFRLSSAIVGRERSISTVDNQFRAESFEGGSKKKKREKKRRRKGRT